jgi:DNA repair protein RadD
MSDLWPHQKFAIEAVPQAFAAGHRRVCLTSPTGGGKSRIVTELVAPWVAQGKRVAVFTNRKMLIDQLAGVMAGAGLEYGVFAAGHRDEWERPLQICSIQTVLSRCVRRAAEGDPLAVQLPRADVVVVDEAHLFGGDETRGVIDWYADNGAVLLLVTATPFGLARLADHLIVAGTTSELRACGALVAAHHYGCDEPDLKHVGRFQVGEDLSERQNCKAIMLPGVFGRVTDWLQRLNPDMRPTLLFAPGVKESVYFAEEFRKAGVRAAHIDGEDVWLDGEFVKSDKRTRDEVIGGHRDGSIPVICNRFVLREGVDLPHVEHLILATVIGSVQSYLQVAGRGLRASPATGKTACTIQDHGGNWHRHGSVNADRDWDLALTAAEAAYRFRDQFLNPPPGAQPPAQPCLCPECGRVLARARCPCGFTVREGQRSRPVIQADGTPKVMDGDVYKPVKRVFKPDTAKLWRDVYWGSVRCGRTFRAAEAYFFQLHHYYPPRNLPWMPKVEGNWGRVVKDVPVGDLNPEEVPNRAR